MPGDPMAVFAQNPDKHETLQMIWPELYDALYVPPEGRRAWGCGFHRGADGEPGPYFPVVARIWLNGPPACRECVAGKSDTPGGYPLKLIDPFSWKGPRA